jgi:hypothetical protein
MGMAEFTKDLSQEYWRPAHAKGNMSQAPGFPSQGNEAFCTVCGTQYAAGARFCHVCGLGREDDLREETLNPLANWINMATLRTRFGLSTVSLVFVLAAAIFMLATVMTGLVYNTSTIAEWQAVQTWRIEWLLAAVVALLAAMLFKPKP